MTNKHRVVVCVRPPEGEGTAAGLGPRDLVALEYAVRLTRRDGGAVTVVATGGDECLPVLREAIARGADASVHVRTDEQSADPLETARRLHQPVRELKPSLVLCGTRSGAGMHGAVPRELAGLLGLPFIGSVVELQIDLDHMTAQAVQALEHGDRWAWGAVLPLLCGVESELCSPRYLAVRRARRADAHQPEPAEPASKTGEHCDDAATPGALEVQGRVAPRIRPKKPKVATTTMSAADRMAMLRGGGKAPAAAGGGGGDNDQPKWIQGDAQTAATEILALLEKREVLPP
jgi:electron transfer flavoprotein alpha/beta subunit